MNWLGKTLTRKFIILLAGFLVLQVFMLVTMTVGVRHLGEEGALINEAGRQRYRTLLVAVRAEEMLVRDGSPADVDSLLREMDDYYGRLSGFIARDGGYEQIFFHDADHGELGAMLEQAETVWRGELRPLIASVDKSHTAASRVALTRYLEAAPAQVARIEKLVTLFERDVRTNTAGLVWFSAMLLAASLGLGLIGFVMARYVVTRPLRRLIEAANAIAGGAYDRRVPVASRDELGELADTFNRMAAAVGDKTMRIAALNDIAVRITSMQSLRDLLDEVMRRGVLLTGAQAAVIAFYNEAEHRFDEWITQGLSNQFVKNIRSLSGGVAEMTFGSGRPIQANDRPETAHKLERQFHEERIRSLVCLPLTSHANRLGVIYFFQKDRDHFFPDEIEILTTFAHLAAGAIENARLQEKTLNLAVTDKLTGLRNRRYFDQRLNEEIHHAGRQQTPLSLLMLDIDDFKLVNDTHGHIVGDRVLQNLGRILTGQLWQVDVASRYGGEEFAVILPQTDTAAAEKVAERIRARVAELRVPLPEKGEIGVTISIGAAAFPLCGDSAEGLTEHADQALYEAKRAGKNCVRVCQAPPAKDGR